MSKLKIKTESLPARCEICHQVDCFDADLNHCTRCVGLTFQINSQLSQPFFQITAATVFDTILSATKLGAKTGAIIAFFPGLSCLMSPHNSDNAFVVVVLAIVGGPLSGLLFGSFFGVIALAFNFIEQLKRRHQRDETPAVNI